MLTRQLLDDTGTLLPLRLRSLDAIHLAAAQRAGDALSVVLTYDTRMPSAPGELGISTASPRWGLLAARYLSPSRHQDRGRRNLQYVMDETSQ